MSVMTTERLLEIYIARAQNAEQELENAKNKLATANQRAAVQRQRHESLLYLMTAISALLAVLLICTVL